MAIAVRAPAAPSILIRKPRVRTLLLFALLIWPWLVPAQPWSNLAVSAAILSLAVVSLVVLTGWVGQISLAQAAIMAVGVFSAAQATTRMGIDFPYHIPIAGLASAVAAVLIGLAALRIRGLYLAIATLAFQWMLEASLLQMHWFSGGFNGITIKSPKVGSWDLSSERIYYYFVWPIVILMVVLVANLRDSKTGRAWFAIRGSEVAARSMGINVTRYKLLAFGVSGFVVGIAGSLQLNLVSQATPGQYLFIFSITLLAVGVLGGIGSLAGAIGIGVVYTLLNEYFLPTYLQSLAEKEAVAIFASLLLIFTLISNPGGLAATREKMKEDHAKRQQRKKMRAARKQHTATLSGAAPTAADTPVVTAVDVQHSPALEGADPAGAIQHTGVEVEPLESHAAEARAQLMARLERRGDRSVRSDRPALLKASDVTVRFGGVVANDSVNLEVRHGEITGLIGPNGAGKTTHFNTLNGLVTPVGGTITFNGHDISSLPTHERAALGMSRTFQIMRLFPRLTVFENIMVGTHLQNTAGTLSNVLMSRRSRGEDSRLSERVHETLSLLGIEHLSDERVAGLPFGTLRLIELARALVASPTLLLLDEPASGLDESETDTFAEILLRIRDEMGPTILLIEHDMALVMAISDYLYVLDFGKNLAEGVPAEVQANPAVIAAYLGEEGTAVG